MSDQSSCERVRRVLGELLDGELEAAQARVLRDHVDNCPTCRGRQDAELHVRRTLRASLTAAGGHPPPRLRVKVMVSIRRETLLRIERSRSPDT